MPVADIGTARDNINSHFNTEWAAGGAATSAFTSLYHDTPGQPPQDGSPWVRLTIIHSTHPAGAIGTVGGVRRWTATGVITVDIHAKAGQGFGVHDPAVEVALNAFRAKSIAGGIIFRNPRPNEIGIDEHGQQQINVLADFEYDVLA
jgi:hypothetical protein